MNRKGFTLIELIATIVLLGIVATIAIVSGSNIFGSAKNKTEEVFVATIKDSLDMYITSAQAKSLLEGGTKCSNTLKKSYGNVNVYKVMTTFKSVIDSEYKPITQDDLVNPSNEEVTCKDANSININIYRDDDYVYYYSVNMGDFACLKSTGVISNLPEGFIC